MSELKFGYLDRDADTEVSSGDLPHWFQPGTAMFVTFRTKDSMPKEAVCRQRRELERWLARNGLPISLADPKGAKGDNVAEPQLSKPELRELKRMKDRPWHGELDRLHGACLLRYPRFAKIVADAIRFYDSQKYDLDRLVIMPNHVHVIVQFRPGESLDVISQSWLRYSARQINAAINGSGEFWQGEPFDHLIRSPEQFEYLRNYIHR